MEIYTNTLNSIVYIILKYLFIILIDNIDKYILILLLY